MSNLGWQDGGVKIEKMKTEVRSQESEWGRPRAMLASSRRCRRPGAEGIRSAETIGIWKAGGDGTRRVMRRGFTALSGWEAGERTAFSHIVAGSTRLFPHRPAFPWYEFGKTLAFAHLLPLSVFLCFLSFVFLLVLAVRISATTPTSPWAAPILTPDS